MVLGEQILIVGVEIDDRTDALPGVHDVVVIAPQVAVLGDARVVGILADLIGRPAAAVEDVATCATDSRNSIEYEYKCDCD